MDTRRLDLDCYELFHHQPWMRNSLEATCLQTFQIKKVMSPYWYDLYGRHFIIRRHPYFDMFSHHISIIPNHNSIVIYLWLYLIFPSLNCLR